VGTIRFETQTSTRPTSRTPSTGVLGAEERPAPHDEGRERERRVRGLPLRAGCGTATDPLSNNPGHIRILQNGSQFTMTSTVLNETCTYVGTPEQRGASPG
jgi:hypothetical protein